MNLPVRYGHFPITLRYGSGDLIPNAELIVDWLWKKSRLLGWRLKIHWLWYASGNLFGLDSTGSLIIVRIWTGRGSTPDPFEKSVADLRRTVTNRHWSAEALRAKWIKYSTLNRFDPEARRIKRSLDLREASGNPSPVFIGLVAWSREDFRPSQSARKNLRSLQKHVGHERAGLRVISASIGPTQMRVQCRTP